MLNKQNKDKKLEGKMGTRGLFGFFYKGKYYVVYNHFDSYPSGLGWNVVDEIINAIKDGSFQGWVAQVEKLVVVDENVPPTPEEIEKLKSWTDLEVSSQSLTDWYCLLRNCQGSLSEVLKSGYIINHIDSRGCPDWKEFAYIVNLDTMKLDFYGYIPVHFDLTVEALTRLRSKWSGKSDSEDAPNNDDVCEEPSTFSGATIASKAPTQNTRSTKVVDSSVYAFLADSKSEGIFRSISECAKVYGDDAFPSSWGTFILSCEDYADVRYNKDPTSLQIWEIGEMTCVYEFPTSVEGLKKMMVKAKFNNSLLNDDEWINLYNFSKVYAEIPEITGVTIKSS